MKIKNRVKNQIGEYMNIANRRAMKKSFLKQVSILILLTIVAYFIIFFQMVASYVSEYETIYKSIYKQNEETIQNSIERIDMFISKIYSDSFMFEEFMRFFDNNVEGYLSQKLDDTKVDERSVDIINECKQFISETDYAIKEIVFRSQYSYNIIKFSEDGSFQVKFSIPLKELNIPLNDITYGIVYSKSLPYPHNISKDMGEILFVLRPEKLFYKPSENQGYNMYVINYGGLITLHESDPFIMNSIISKIMLDNKEEGFIGNIFNRVYYSNQISEAYQYQLISFITTRAIVSQNYKSFMLLTFLSSIVFLLILSILYIRRKKDMSFLDDIITSIAEVKQGQFVHTNFKSRNDEYGLIATELNDMASKINSFIEKEYILKINQQEAEMKALQNQINPHFLYNTLEIIRSKALQCNDVEVSDAISNLGSLYRNIVKTENEITIEKELDILNRYLKLMEFKYNSNFYYQIDCDEQTLQLRTVKLWMQPIVENFIKHGLDEESDYNLLLIIGRSFDDYYEIKFIDNGVNIDLEKLNQLNNMFSSPQDIDIKQASGLENVFCRLSKFYNNQIQMYIENNETAGVTTAIKIMK